MKEPDSRIAANDQVIRRLLAEGRYVVREDGAIIDTRPAFSRPPREVTRVISATGAVRCHLSVGPRKQVKVLVGRMVAMHFHGAPGEGQEAFHLNGDKADNRPINLRWMDHDATMHNASGNGAMVGAPGERNGAAKLTRAAVSDIRRSLVDGISRARIAAQHGVSWTLINKIRVGEIWAGAAHG